MARYSCDPSFQLFTLPFAMLCRLARTQLECVDVDRCRTWMCSGEPTELVVALDGVLAMDADHASEGLAEVLVRVLMHTGTAAVAGCALLSQMLHCTGMRLAGLAFQSLPPSRRAIHQSVVCWLMCPHAVHQSPLRARRCVGRHPGGTEAGCA